MQILQFTEQHEEFRGRLQDFLKREVIPHVDQWEKDHITPRNAWKRIGEAGFLCPCVSKDYGGMGGDFLHSVIVNEEMTRTNHVGLMVNLHSDIVVPYIGTFGTEEQKKKYLPGCVSGNIVTAVAMTEPGAGSDVASLETTAVEEGDGIVLNGSKTFISNGHNCDLVVVAAKDPAGSVPHKAISLYLVEGGTPGFKKGSILEKMGMHSQDTAELFFTNCRIPKENQLGEKGNGFVMLMQKLQQERLVIAIQAIAACEFALEYTTDFCRSTLVDGQPLAQSQAVQFALAEMAADVTIGRTFLHSLVADHMANKDVRLEVSMAKFWNTDLVKRTVGRALDIIGEFGITEDCPLARMWRDVQVWSIFAGSNEVMKTIIAKAMKL